MMFSWISHLNISKCNVTCSDQWIRPENLSEQEKERIRRSFPVFADRFATLEQLHYVHCERNVLSGLVLFRTELLPLSIEVLGSDDVMSPFVLRLLHWEGVIRQRLSGKTDTDFYSIDDSLHDETLVQDLHYLRAGHIPKSIKSTHKWWNEHFIDSEDQNLTGEYDLTD